MNIQFRMTSFIGLKPKIFNILSHHDFSRKDIEIILKNQQFRSLIKGRAIDRMALFKQGIGTGIIKDLEKVGIRTKWHEIAAVEEDKTPSGANLTRARFPDKKL